MTHTITRTFTEHAVLFYPEMVKAIMEERKTMTRRLIKHKVYGISIPDDLGYTLTTEGIALLNGPDYPDGKEDEVRCPFGGIGDRLWVREQHFKFGHWVKNGISKTGRQKWKFVQDSQLVLYYETPPEKYRKSMDKKNPGEPQWYWRLGRFMFRKDSRLTLEISELKVEMLQDISQEDAENEGVSIDDDGMFCMNYQRKKMEMICPEESFESLWKLIHGDESWDSNSWVWVIGFKKI